PDPERGPGRPGGRGAGEQPHRRPGPPRRHAQAARRGAVGTGPARNRERRQAGLTTRTARNPRASSQETAAAAPMGLKSARLGGPGMRLRHAVGVGCSLLLLGQSGAAAAAARAPPPAGGAAAPGGGAAAGAAASTAAAPGTAATAAGRAKGPFAKLMECLCPTPEQKEAKRERFCKSAVGQLFN